MYFMKQWRTSLTNPKKRKTLNDSVSLTQQDARKILQPLTKDQLIDILQTLITHDVAALSAVRSIADTDPSHRKLFIRGIGWDTTTTTLKSVFEQYSEEEEGLVIVDKATNKSKGYGFVTFKHVDGAVKALVEPSKKIDGRITVSGWWDDAVAWSSARDCEYSVSYCRVGKGAIIPKVTPLPGLIRCGMNPFMGGYASAAAATPEYHGQNNYGPSVNRWPPAQGGYVDGGNYAPSPGYPTQSNMPPAGPRGPHAGMYHGGHLDYNSEEGARRAVVNLVKSIDGYHQVMWMGRRGDRVLG
nr:UBP1-associated protein 2C-like [Tanacetum cinerariifolium]